MFKINLLSNALALSIGVFTLLTIIYSIRFMKGKPRLIQYYAFIILTSVASLGVVYANNLILLLACWGVLGLTLYILMNIDRADAAPAAKKMFIIVGGSDALMLLGIAIIYYLTGTFEIDKIKLSLEPQAPNIFLATLAYLCLAFASFAKAGAMPMHSWIPDCARYAPVPVVAFLPASLDKLLGIYLLFKISTDLFIMNSALNIFLMSIGALTIVAAVMMALVQHNMKRLLGYHAVSQVGYMVLGIGTGTPIGIAGALFHMFNNAIYKSCLFLTSGNIEYRTGTTELDELGGLSRRMPITYVTMLIASLSISGVPPFNGFFSKWMIYQGLVNHLQNASSGLKIMSTLCLVAAMFGSGLTIASFMKIIHANFLGQGSSVKESKQVNEVPWQMWLSCFVLAGLCVVFGVFATQIPLRYLVLPAVSFVTFIGTWYAGLSTLLIIIALAIGVLVVNFGVFKPSLRRDIAFTGTEPMDLAENRVTGTDFYNTIREFAIFSAIYKKAESGYFDIYERLKRLIFSVSRALQYLHNGVLPTYLVWYLLGMAGLFLWFLR